MSNEKQGRRLQARWDKEDKNARERAIKKILSDADGRYFLWSLLGDCRVFNQPYAGNALQTAFNCGELNVGQALLAAITEADPDAFLVMMKENLENERSRTADATSLARADAGSDPTTDPASFE